MVEFIKREGNPLVSYYAGILGVILPCLSTKLAHLVLAMHEDHFVVGDCSFVKLPTYWQHSVRLQQYHQLGRQYFGPFKVLQHIWVVVFKFELFEAERIYLISRISTLKCCNNQPNQQNVLLQNLEGKVLNSGGSIVVNRNNLDNTCGSVIWTKVSQAVGPRVTVCTKVFGVWFRSYIYFQLWKKFSEEDTFPEKPKEYRLFVHSYEDQIDLWQPSRSNVRSLLFNVINPDNFLWPRDISFIFNNFKLVRVLDLESFNIGGTFPSAIQSLIHLRLEFLNHLESLKLISNSCPAKIPHVFSFPSRLRELTLSKFRLPWNQISTIAKLPNLEILKLLLRAFEGDEWEVKDSEFPELKYIELDDLNITQWSVSEYAFPMLEHLVLTKCKKLKEIPSHFDNAISLRRIEVNWCSWPNSAQQIQRTQREDMTNDALTITVPPPDWARGSSP
ncbi:putative late blight resistance protein homolog R1B-11 [Nicotiana tabacum]|uniref:Late blight resistance protein homolog R1B-11 n=1 Tax=Nicotiana tabacum TaxID=4097 RepID=A0AC58U1R3_TOBAC